jgi:hypothetical protein
MFLEDIAWRDSAAALIFSVPLVAARSQVD